MTANAEHRILDDHSGGPCPVASDRKVVVRYRNGIVSSEIVARERRWRVDRETLGTATGTSSRGG